MPTAVAVQNEFAEDVNMGQSEEAFLQLAEAERVGLMRLAWGMLSDYHEAEDLVQESLMRLYPRWDQTRNPRSFLYKTLSNLCIDVLRKRARTPPELPGDQPARSPVPDRETKLAVRAALEQLEPKQRAAVILREVQGLSYAEIAETLDASVHQVTNWLHRGKMELRRLLVPYTEGGQRIW